jgi:outer membrane protein OmpA-like peptidoglycan-associated protein
MNYFSLLLLTLLPWILRSQNLVPNGGFEHNTRGQVSDWRQPLDDYYHYTLTVDRTDSGNFYNAINGLCLLQPDPSEFLIAKLNQPLVKGKTYCAGLNIYYSTTFIGTVKSLYTIDVAFSDTSIEVWKRRKLYREPKLRFPFMDSAGVFVQPRRVVFEADGTEAYIIIGKFHTQGEQFSLSIEDRRAMLYKEQYYAADSIKRYFLTLLPPPKAAGTKREIRRETKRLNDSIAKLDAAKMEALYANAQYYREKVNALSTQPEDTSIFHPRYHVRMYFDNICVAPVLLNNECACDEKTIPHFEVGQTYRLNNIHFDLDKSTFRPESYQEMDNLKSILDQYPGMVIQLNGHTDSLNTEKYNLDLSNRRAKAVFDYLVKKGISPKRLQWKGYGESVPLTENTTEEGRAINRRVEFIVLQNNE